MAEPQNQTVRPDSKGRISLGTYAKGVSSYRIHEEKDGRIVLEPYKEIPARETWLYQNPTALKKVRKGLRDAMDGKVKRGGDFTKFIDD